MKLSPVRILLVLLFVFIGCFGIAYAAAGMLTALPAPAIGGTCGPSTGSETALEALARPGSIGAGPEPSTTNTTAHHQWQTFVDQCQTLATRRGLASLAVLVVSLGVAAIGLILVLRKPKRDSDGTASEQGDLSGTPSYTPLGLHDQASLVGAAAVVGAPAAPVAAWPSTQPPVYGAPPAYPAPPYPGSPAEGAYPPQAWPAQRARNRSGAGTRRLPRATVGALAAVLSARRAPLPDRGTTAGRLSGCRVPRSAIPRTGRSPPGDHGTGLVHPGDSAQSGTPRSAVPGATGCLASDRRAGPRDARLRRPERNAGGATRPSGPQPGPARLIPGSGTTRSVAGDRTFGGAGGDRTHDQGIMSPVL